MNFIIAISFIIKIIKSYIVRARHYNIYVIIPWDKTLVAYCTE